MVAPLNTCTTIEQRGVVLFCGQKIWKQRIHKEMLPILAAFPVCGYIICIKVVLYYFDWAGKLGGSEETRDGLGVKIHSHP
jgi:hypothetical protein